MKVVFATHAYAPVVGGAERYAQGLAEALAGLGHEVHVLTPNRVSAEAFYTTGYSRAGVASETMGGVAVHRLRLDPPLLSSFGGASHSLLSDTRRQRMWNSYERALHDTIADLSPEVTITLPHDFPNVAAALTARARGIGVYAPLLHEQDPAWDIDTIATLVAQSDRVLAMTHWERRRLIDAYGATPEATLVVPPGVEAPDVETVAASGRDAPYVLSVGRRTASKNLPATAAVVSALRSEGFDLQHLVVGPGDAHQLDDSLDAFGDAVEVVGEVDEATKWSLIKGAVAMVSMSEHESFGIAAVESWRMGRPIIALQTPVSKELVSHNTDGFLVKDASGLHDAVETLLQDPDRATTMGTAGFEHAKQFSWQTSAEIFLEAVPVPPSGGTTEERSDDAAEPRPHPVPPSGGTTEERSDDVDTPGV
ncbi:MAG: glycosyltransferase family 4 protein [Acidimicrobiia bacterium]|nr:glycosyltransferase family 4 protein [Acidimicrobiia bacterium]